MFNFSVEGQSQTQGADVEEEKKGPAEVVSFLSLVCHLIEFWEKSIKNIYSFDFQMYWTSFICSSVQLLVKLIFIKFFFLSIANIYLYLALAHGAAFPLSELLIW